MGDYHRLTLAERYQIEALLGSGLSFGQISRQLGRSVSTISREVSRFRTRQAYRADFAESLAQQAGYRGQAKCRRITGELADYVVSRLRLDWSPEQIDGSLRREQQTCVVSYQTIYRFIRRDRACGGKLYRHLRILRKQRKDRKKAAWRPKTHWRLRDRRDIEMRPEIVEKRVRVGDYERDLVLGKRGRSVLLTVVDRTSKLLKLQCLEKNLSGLVHRATVRLLKGEPVETITNDNGREFALHRTTEKALGAKVYFSKAYRSWERGTNENINGLIRQYFPKKKDIGNPPRKRIQEIEHLINTRPRKCLGYRTPLEVHEELKQKQASALR